MKKIILSAALIIGLTTVSCRKERSCECKTNETEVRIGFGEQTTVSNSSTKVTKAKQKKNRFQQTEGCYSETYSYNSSGGNGPTAWSSVTTVDSNCELN